MRPFKLLTDDDDDDDEDEAAAAAAAAAAACNIDDEFGLVDELFDELLCATSDYNILKSFFWKVVHLKKLLKNYNFKFFAVKF